MLHIGWIYFYQRGRFACPQLKSPGRRFWLGYKSVRDRPSAREEGEITTPTPHNVKLWWTILRSPEKESISGIDTSDKLLAMGSTRSTDSQETRTCGPMALWSSRIQQRSQGLKETQPCGSGYRKAQETRTCGLCSSSLPSSLQLIVFITFFL